MKRVLLLSLLLVAPLAHANSSCDRPRDDFDGLYCLNKVYLEADGELNEAYKNLAGTLDSDGKSALKRGQISWIKARNEQCSYKNERGFFVNLRCATDTTVSRLQFLQDRLRECRSAGCQNSKLQ